MKKQFISLSLVAIMVYSCENRQKTSAIAADSTNQQEKTATNFIVPDNLNAVKALAEDFAPKEVYLEIMTRIKEQNKDTFPSEILLNYTKEELAQFEQKNERLHALTNDDLLTLYEKSFQGKKVIYGVDDRIDVIYEKNNISNVNTDGDNPFMVDGRSVIAIIPKMNMVYNVANKTYRVSNYSSLKTKYKLCSSESFLNQPVASICSGFAATENKIVTAGHCVDPSNFKNFYYVFDYIMKDPENFDPVIKAESVFEAIDCKSVQVPNQTDYAVIEVASPIPSFRIARIDDNGKIQPSDQFHVIGTPCGIPLKLAGNAILRDNGNKNFFIINSDTYGGNSGSPVFNSSTHKVEGILVSGEKDFKWSFFNTKECQVSVICPFNGCSGESVSRNLQYLSSLKN